MKRVNLLILAAIVCPFTCLAETTHTEDHPIESWISFLPVIFFFLIIAITTFKLRNDKIKLSDLLAEKDASVPPVQNDTNNNTTQSVSRFIAFLTGLVALTIGVCLTTFFLYEYFNNPKEPPNLTNLTTVIWGLGIGVLPYGFNKASSALKPQ
ncbi:MAG TPA: hypothetical protein VL442_18560 [Mucilaginibacter sp.]|jgi:hypothetical protein|nr:hypothetical protein [Mucilaginibacter sp.]